MTQLQRTIYCSVKNLCLRRHGRIRTLQTCESGKKGLVLGAYKGILPADITFTPTAQKFDSEIGGKLRTLVLEAGLDDGKVQVFSSVPSDYHAVAVAGMGSENSNLFSWIEDTKDYKEKIRVAAGVGAMALQDMGISNIEVEAMTDAEAAAEGAALGVWQDFEHDINISQSNIQLYKQGGDDSRREEWERGYVKAEAQNLARYLSGTPANIMTLSKFANHCKDILCPYGVQVKIRDRDYIKQKQMGALWAITEGSCDSPSLIEMHYNGSDVAERPIVLVGKGCTFDLGGLCLHPHGTMSYHHGGMAGAASIVGVFKALCQFKLSINVSAILPLYENIISLSMETNNEKRTRSVLDDMAVLVDVLSYSAIFRPRLVINIAALLKCRDESDAYNSSQGIVGVPRISPGFLKEFLPDDVDFCHIITDIKKDESEKESYPYLRPNLNTGRPTRLLIQFLQNRACLNYTFLD